MKINTSERRNPYVGALLLAGMAVGVVMLIYGLSGLF